MGVKLWINKNHIYLSLCYNGKRWRESTGLTVSTDSKQNKKIMQMAEIIRSNREIGIAAGLQGLQAESNETLYDYCKKNLSENRYMTAALKYIEKFGGKDIKVRNVNQDWYKDYIEKIKHEPKLVKSSTQFGYIAALRSCLIHAFNEGILPKNITDGVKTVKVQKVKKVFLNEDELKRMVETREPEDEAKMGFLIGCFTGLRYSDIRKLKWQDIDFENKIIPIVMSKTRELVNIPLSEFAEKLLKEIPKNGEFVFPRLNKIEGTMQTNREIMNWAKSLDIHKHVTWHIGRHTHAVLLLESGAEIYTVQRLLGHTNIKTTQVYADITDKTKIKAEEELSKKFE